MLKSSSRHGILPHVDLNARAAVGELQEARPSRNVRIARMRPPVLVRDLRGVELLTGLRAVLGDQLADRRRRPRSACG